MSKLPKYLLKSIAIFALLFILFITAGVASADNTSVPGAKCVNAFPNLMTDICWKCLFPIRIGGNAIMNFGDMPDNIDESNVGDYNPSSFVCTCPNPKSLLPDLGLYTSYWEPSRVLEVVMKPNCFPFLFGLDTGDTLNLFGAQGQHGSSDATHSSKLASYNVHYLVFPLFEIVQLLVGADYCTDWMTKIDLLYFTEVDPLWRNDELTAIINPESLVFANPIAQALCAPDCLAATAGFPMNALPWCSGCWGSMYPYTGNTSVVGLPVRVTSLLAGRVLARMARLPVPPAQEFDTSGPGAKCGGQFMPFIKKSQYKFSTIFPIPETSGKCCHTLGSSPMAWGEYRNIPGAGEFQIYMEWRKRNCCLKIL